MSGREQLDRYPDHATGSQLRDERLITLRPLQDQDPALVQILLESQLVRIPGCQAIQIDVRQRDPAPVLVHQSKRRTSVPAARTKRSRHPVGEDRFPGTERAG